MVQKTLLKISAIIMLLGICLGILGAVSHIFSDTESDSNSSGTILAILCCAYMPMIILIISTRKKRKNFILIKKIKKSKIKRAKGEKSEMLEFAKRFIEKDCIISLFDGSMYTGVIKEVVDNAMLIEKNGELTAVNLEFVSSIKEFPKNKKGKRKSIAY